MATYYGIDIRSEEQDGDVVRATWTAKVDLDSVPSTDPAQAIEAFLDPAQTGTPAPGNEITIRGTTLELTERGVRIIGNKKAELTLTYVKPGFGAFGGTPPVDVYQGTSVLETTTTQEDRNGTQITLTYDGTTQPATVNVREPRPGLTVDKVITTPSPELFQMLYMGKVNADTWKSGQPGTWIIDGVNYVPEDLNTNKWRFTFNFTHNANGWQPEAVFIDPETNEPPVFDEQTDAGIAYKEIEWYEELPFGSFFT